MKKQQIFFLSIMLFLCMVFAPPQKAQAQFIPVDSIVYGPNNIGWCPLVGGEYICHITIGDTRGLFCFTLPYNATTPGVTYQSMNTEIVTVSNYYPGSTEVFANSVGETEIIIRALDPNYTGYYTLKVIVEDLKPGDLEIDPPMKQMVEGEWFWPAVKMNGTYGGFNNLKWTSNNNSVADLDLYGRIFAYNYGIAIITATAPNGVKADCFVSVTRRAPGVPSQQPTIETVTGHSYHFGKFDDSGYPIYETNIGNQIKIICKGEVDGIKYTTEGSDPTTSLNVNSRYCEQGSEIITIREKTTIRAVAFNTDAHRNETYGKEVNATFSPKLAEPFITSNPDRGLGDFFYGDRIILNTPNSIPGIKIRYTLDGSDPNSSSKEYSPPGILLDGTVPTQKSSGENYQVIIKAKAFCDGYVESNYVVESRIFRLLAPTFNTASGQMWHGASSNQTTQGSYANIYYTLSDKPDVMPTTGSTLCSGFISTAGITNFKYLNARAFSKPGTGISPSYPYSCKYYAKPPMPEVQLYNFYNLKWYSSPKTDFIVGSGDSMKLATPDYPETLIRFSDKLQTVSLTQGNDWVEGYSYPIYEQTRITALSKLGENISNIATFHFSVMDKPSKPVFSESLISIEPGTYLCITCSSPHDGIIMTDDGTDPYIYVRHGLDLDNNVTGLVWAHGNYILKKGAHCFTESLTNYLNWNNTDTLKIMKTGMYKAIAFRRAPDGSFVMSDVAQKEYQVKPLDGKLDVDNSETDVTFQNGNNVDNMGLLGKILKIALKLLDVKNECIDSKNYKTVCQSYTENFSDQKKRDKVMPELDKYFGLSRHIKEIEDDYINPAQQWMQQQSFFTNDYEEIKKLLNPYKYNYPAQGNEKDVFKFNFEASGMLKDEVIVIKKGENGKPDEKKSKLLGGMSIKADAHIKAGGTYPLGPFEAKVEFKLDAELKMGVSTEVTLDDPKASPPKINTESKSYMEYYINAHLGVGIGIPYLASVEVHAEGTLTHKWLMHLNKHRMTLHGSVYAEAKVMGARVCYIEFVKRKAEEPWVLYDNGFPPKPKSSGASDFNATDFDISELPDFAKILKDSPQSSNYQFTILPRKYLAKRSPWLGSIPSARDDSPFKILQESIYSETEPKIAEGGGKRVMVFLADDENQDEYNRSRLMSSVYNAATETWSEPVPVYNSGSADYFPSIASNGTNIWVTWQNSKTLFNSSSTLEDRFAAGEIAIARFNSATDEFDLPTFLTNNSISDAAPKLTVTPSGGVNVAWIQNTSNNPFSETKTNKIMEARHNGTTLLGISELTSVQGPVYDLDVAWFNSKVLFAYTTKGDNKEDNVRNFYTMELGSTTPQKLVSNKVVSGVRYSAIGNTKVLSWLEDYKLRYLPQGGTPQNMVDSADMMFENYKIFTNGTKTAVVYPSTRDRMGYLFARNVEAGKMGNPYKLVNTTGVPHKFDGVLENSGEFYIVYNSSVKELVNDEIEEENTFMAFKHAEPVNLRLKYVGYEHDEVKLGKPLKVKLDIANIGGVTVNNVVVKVNGTAVGTYPLNVKPIEEKSVEFNINIPSTMTPRTMFKITIEPAGLTDIDMNDNISDITLGFVNFYMGLTEEYKNGNKVTITADIRNESDFAANTKLIVRHAAVDGPVLAFKDIGNFAARSSKTFKFDFDVDAICPQGGLEHLYFELISNKDAKSNCIRNTIIHNNTYTIPYDSLHIGIKDPQPTVFDNNSVLVYPNPTTGEVKVMIVGQVRDEVNIDNVDVYDMFGRKILTHTPHPTPHTSFNVAHLQAGIYFLRVQTDRDLVVKKLIKY